MQKNANLHGRKGAGGARYGQDGAKMEPKWGQDGVKTANKSEITRQRINKEGGVPQSRLILVEKVANIAPTWIPKWSQDGQKVNAKIDHFLMPLGNVFFEFRWFLCGITESSWHQNGIKDRFLRKHGKTHVELAR